MIKLDLKDRRILYELDQNSRQPNSQIAKKVKLPASVVNYRINRLVKEGIITRFVTVVNYSKFGITTYKVYVQFQGINEQKEKELITYLNNNQKINYVATYSGHWDLVFAVYTKKVSEFDKVMDEFLNKYSVYILNKALSILIEVEIYKRGYILEKQGTAIARFGGKIEEVELGKKDIEILKILENDARTSIVNIARKLNTTSRIVNYRIKQLEKKGVIITYRIDMNHSLLGFEFYKAFITVGNYVENKEKSFRIYCRRLPTCLHLVKSIGNWDYELEFEVRSHTEFNKILKDMRAYFGDFIKKIDNVLIEKEHKFKFL